MQGDHGREGRSSALGVRLADEVESLILALVLGVGAEHRVLDVIVRAPCPEQCHDRLEIHGGAAQRRRQPVRVGVLHMILDLHQSYRRVVCVLALTRSFGLANELMGKPWFARRAVLCAIARRAAVAIE